MQATDDDRLRLQWGKEFVEGAPAYNHEDDRGLFSDDPEAMGISSATEEAAYAQYGLESGERDRRGGAQAACLRASPRDVSEPPATAE